MKSLTTVDLPETMWWGWLQYHPEGGRGGGKRTPREKGLREGVCMSR